MCTEFNVTAGDSQWTWRQTNAEVYGVNIVIWVHDPKAPDKRAEITQAPSHVDLDKAAGWNSHELDPTVTQFFWYGENVTSADGTATELTSGPVIASLGATIKISQPACLSLLVIRGYLPPDPTSIAIKSIG